MCVLTLASPALQGLVKLTKLIDSGRPPVEEERLPPGHARFMAACLLQQVAELHRARRTHTKVHPSAIYVDMETGYLKLDMEHKGPG